LADQETGLILSHMGLKDQLSISNQVAIELIDPALFLFSSLGYP
jgi:hypothetical protein